MPRRTDAGATAVEYGIMLALIAAVIVASVRVLGEAVAGFFNSAIGTF